MNEVSSFLDAELRRKGRYSMGVSARVPAMTSFFARAMASMKLLLPDALGPNIAADLRSRVPFRGSTRCSFFFVPRPDRRFST